MQKNIIPWSVRVNLATSCFAVSVLSSSAAAGLITFETAPDGSVSTDDLVIPLTSYYETDNGVRVSFGFSRVADGTLDAEDIPGVIEDTSRSGIFVKYRDTLSPTDDRYGYVSYGSTWGGTDEDGNSIDPNQLVTDTIAPGFENQAGAYVLRSAKDGDPGYSRGSSTDDNWEQFIIVFDDVNQVGVTASSGEIWDIDIGNTTEAFSVNAYDEYGNLLATKLSPLGLDATDPNSLDAEPWMFAFDPTNDGYTGYISKLVFNRTGGAPGQSYPLAFNNFNPLNGSGYAAVPESSSFLLFSVLTAVTIQFRRRNRKTHSATKADQNSTASRSTPKC